MAATKPSAKHTTASLEHYTRLDAASMNHTHPGCGCRLARDEMGAVALYHCPTHATAPEMALALDATARLWHYAAIPGSPCYKLAFSRCEGLRCATNRTLLRRIGGER